MLTHHRVAHALCDGQARDFSEYAATAERIGGDYDRQLRGTVHLLIGYPVAERIAEEVFRYRFGLKRPDQREWNDERRNNTLIDQWEHIQSIALREIENLIYPDTTEPMLKEGALFKYGKQRTIEAVTYSDSDVFAKKRHDCEEKDRFATRHDFKEPQGIFEAEINPYDLCENRWERDTLEMLLEDKMPIAEIARRQRCSTKTICGFKDRLLTRNPQTRTPRTARPAALRNIEPLPHDNCSPESGCPVTRFKTACNLDARDELLIDLYRDGLEFDDIAAETGWNGKWVKQRLGELAYAYLTM